MTAPSKVNDRTSEQGRLAERLREAREYLGLSQEQVASKAGISRAAISSIENGKRKVEALELQALSSVYKQPVDYLLGSTPDIPESVQAIAREAGTLTPGDREEVLRFAQFLKGYRGSLGSSSNSPR